MLIKKYEELVFENDKIKLIEIKKKSFIERDEKDCIYKEEIYKKYHIFKLIIDDNREESFDFYLMKNKDIKKFIEIIKDIQYIEREDFINKINNEVNDFNFPNEPFVVPPP